MSQEPHPDFANEHVLEHLEDEIKTLEGVTRWKRPVGIGLLVLGAAAIVGGLAWFVLSPPPTTSGRASTFVTSTGTPLDLLEPKGATLTAPPERLVWESVTGRLQYVVRVYPKGSGMPVFERITTSPSIELSADDQARIPRGNTYIWKVVAQGKNGTTIAEGVSTFKVR